MHTSLDVARKYADLCADAEVEGRMVEYDDILALDTELQQCIARRPAWMRIEDLSAQKQQPLTRVRRFAALVVSCTLWHRSFVIVSGLPL